MKITYEFDSIHEYHDLLEGNEEDLEEKLKEMEETKALSHQSKAYFEQRKSMEELKEAFSKLQHSLGKTKEGSPDYIEAVDEFMDYCEGTFEELKVIAMEYIEEETDE